MTPTTKINKCPRCNFTLLEIPITRGNRIVATNYFCSNPNCKYERDTITPIEK